METFSQIFQNEEFFSKIWLWLFHLYSLLNSCKKSENPLSCFWENCVTNQPTNASLETFSRISPNQEFFSKIRLLCPYSPLTSCKRSEKFETFLRKLRYQPTKQPINYYQQHQFYRNWVSRVQWWKEMISIRIIFMSVFLCFSYYNIPHRFLFNLFWQKL